MHEGKRGEIKNDFEKGKPILVTLCLEKHKDFGTTSKKFYLEYILDENVSLSVDLKKEEVPSKLSPEENDEEYLKRICKDEHVAKMIEKISVEHKRRPIILDVEIR
ncbi:MAG TPA: hypothetical protein PKH95_02225 [Candidatus Magasanikbacteria bacterium]|nr:hypothetical protein [Candidatus Magasanikbacteria bacterium]